LPYFSKTDVDIWRWLQYLFDFDMYIHKKFGGDGATENNKKWDKPKFIPFK